MIENLNVPGGNTVAVVTDEVAKSYDGVTLSMTYDNSTYDQATGSYKILSVTGDNPTGTNGFPARDVTIWAVYKGRFVSAPVPAGTSQTWTPNGNRTTADVSQVGIS